MSIEKQIEKHYCDMYGIKTSTPPPEPPLVDSSNFKFSFFKETKFFKMAEISDKLTNYMIVKAELPIGAPTYAVLVNLKKDGQDCWYPSPWVNQALHAKLKELPELDPTRSSPVQVGSTQASE